MTANWTALSALAFDWGRNGTLLSSVTALSSWNRFHTDSASPSSFVSTYGAPAVRERLLHAYDDAVLDAHVQSLNMWVLLEGERTPWRPSSEPENKIAPECEALIGALNGAAATDDEAECAQQMRDILASKETLSFRSLVDEPQQLLQCSEHMCNSAPGALWTRFTVSYNLYAGSVVALGSDEQRAELFALQSELGCFHE